MLLATIARYRFVGRPPRSFVVVFVLGVVNFWVSWIAIASHQLWARGTSGGEFTYPVRISGRMWYFMPALGRYIEWSLPAGFVALALLALISYRHRDKLVRVLPDNTTDTSSERSS